MLITNSHQTHFIIKSERVKNSPSHRRMLLNILLICNIKFTVLETLKASNEGVSGTHDVSSTHTSISLCEAKTKEWRKNCTESTFSTKTHRTFIPNQQQTHNSNEAKS